MSRPFVDRAAAASVSATARRTPIARGSDVAIAPRAPLDGGLLFAVRCFALIRLGFMALALVVHETLARPTIEPNSFDLVLGLGTLYALALVALAVRRPQPLLHWRRLGLVDLALVAALVLYTGGPYSPLRFAFFAIPFVVAFVARPRWMVPWSLAAIAGYVLVTLVVPRPDAGALPGVTPAEVAALVFAVLGAVAFSAVLVRLERAVAEYARRASALAEALVRVEERERRALADALHDGPVQHIASASRELASAVEGGPAQLHEAHAQLGTALEQLRGQIFDLYPHVLDHGGLASAVEELARQVCGRGGLRVHVTVEPAAAGVDDVAVMAVLRELLRNVAKHAGASAVDVVVRAEDGGHVLVEVCDDGCGFVPPAPDEAVAARQFGLHATRERLRALGGSLVLASAPGEGTRASAWIPIGARATPAARRAAA